MGKKRIYIYIYIHGKLFNGPFQVITKIIKTIISSKVESEYGNLHINADEVVVFVTKLEEFGHPKRLVPIKTDKSTTNVNMNETIKRKQKMIMICFWLFYKTE